MNFLMRAQFLIDLTMRALKKLVKSQLVFFEVKFLCKKHEGETRDIVEHLSITKVDDVSTNSFVLLKHKIPAAI